MKYYETASDGNTLNSIRDLCHYGFTRVSVRLCVPFEITSMFIALHVQHLHLNDLRQQLSA